MSLGLVIKQLYFNLLNYIIFLLPLPFVVNLCVCVCVQYNALLLGDLVRLDEVDIATSRQRASETMLFCSKFYTNATSVIQNCAVF